MFLRNQPAHYMTRSRKTIHNTQLATTMVGLQPPFRQRRRRQRGWMRAVLALSSLPLVCAQVPGLIYTYSGYDNLDGTDPICWSAVADTTTATAATTFAGKQWQNDLIPSFVAGPTSMLPTCPNGTQLQLDVTEEESFGSHRLRVGRLYTYNLTARLDLEVIRRENNLSNDSFLIAEGGEKALSLKIIFCSVSGNLCSPFALSNTSIELDTHLLRGDDDHDEIHSEDDEDESSEGFYDMGLRLVVKEQSDSRPPAITNAAKASASVVAVMDDVSESVLEINIALDIKVDVPGVYLPLGK